MRRLLPIFAVCASILGLAGAHAADREMIEIDYRDQDSDTAMYRTRVLVSPAFMRLDYGKDGDDFVLLDRKNQRIYNVTHEKKEILEIGGGPFSLNKPEPWTLRHEVKAAPLGKNTRKVKLYVNDVLCSEVTAQPGLLPDAVAALKQYRALLRQVQASVFNAQASEQREYCELAQHVFETSRELDFGLPLAETYQNGRTRASLNNIKNAGSNLRFLRCPKLIASLTSAISAEASSRKYYREKRLWPALELVGAI